MRGINRDVRGEEEERGGDEAVRAPVEGRDAVRVEAAPLPEESPEKHRRRGALDEAVDPEPEERDAPRRERRRDGDHALDDVPADGEVLEAEGVVDECGAVWGPFDHSCLVGAGDAPGGSPAV